MRLNPVAFETNYRSNYFQKKTQCSASFALNSVITNKKVAQILSNNYSYKPLNNISFGSKQMLVSRGVDEIILKITDLEKKASSVQIEAGVKSESDSDFERVLFSAKKRNSDGLFNVIIPTINYKDNEFLDKIKLNHAIFFDSNGNILKKTDLNKEFSPRTQIAKEILGKFSLNNKPVDGGFSIVSVADRDGRFKIFNDYEDLKNYRGKEPVIAMLDPNTANDMIIDISLNEDFSIPSKVVGILANVGDIKLDYNNQFLLSSLSHAKCRLEGKQGFSLINSDIADAISLGCKDGDFVKLNTDVKNITMNKVKKLSETNDVVKLSPIKMSRGILTPGDSGFTADSVGVKAYNLGELQKIAQETGLFSVPKFFAIPAGEFMHMHDLNPLACDKKGNPVYEAALTKLINAYKNNEPLERHLNAMKDIIKNEELADSFKEQCMQKISELFGSLLDDLEVKNELQNITNNNVVLSVRSSFPGIEDLHKVASQGMFSSVGGVRTWKEFFEAVLKVAASKWGEIAARSRIEHSIPHESVQPAVVVQEFVKDIDYIMTGYTRQVSKPDKMLIDLSQGVSSTMAGCPYLFEVDRNTGEIERILMATKGRKKLIENVNLLDKRNANYVECDYSQDVLNKAKEEYAPVIKKIANALLTVEKHFRGKAQDIEGGIKFVKNAQGETDVKITLWQTRDVQMPKAA